MKVVHIHDVEVRIKMHAPEMHESISGARGFRNRADWKLNASFRPRAQGTIVLQVGVELFCEIAGRFVERMGCASGGGWTACINYAKHPYALIINHGRWYSTDRENSVGGGTSLRMEQFKIPVYVPIHILTFHNRTSTRPADDLWTSWRDEKFSLAR